MNNAFKLKFAALLWGCAAFNHPLTTAWAQGSLTPPGAPVASMKSLDQIHARLEARTPITNASSQVILSAPGSYYLTTNLTVNGGDAVVISASGVTLDLNGFTISSTAASANGNAITINNFTADLTIQNGHIRGGVTNNGSGTYSGPGFAAGISGPSLRNARVSGVSVSGCLTYGIYLTTVGAAATTVEDCSVQTMGTSGIYAATVRNCISLDCGGTAINCSQASDCRGESTGNGYGIFAISSAANCQCVASSNYGLYTIAAQNCYGSSSTGYGIYATQAQNCYGASSTGTGLSATSALGCSGLSTTSYGLYITVVAENCYGYSSSGYGLLTTLAQNCYGTSSTGTGLYAATAQNCRGYSFGNGNGLYSFQANSCYGSSTSGIGLSATYGNFCTGSSVSVTTKYNMP